MKLKYNGQQKNVKLGGCAKYLLYYLLQYCFFFTGYSIVESFVYDCRAVEQIALFGGLFLAIPFKTMILVRGYISFTYTQKKESLGYFLPISISSNSYDKIQRFHNIRYSFCRNTPRMVGIFPIWYGMIYVMLLGCLFIICVLRGN